MCKSKLQIVLITYNRKRKLQQTFDYIFAANSPIKDYDITILDNASTDGTSELIAEYCIKYPNLKHFKHKINIGGNANIARAYEVGASSGKEYVWVLCDDDKYDFSNWAEVEKNINNNVDIICLADYVFPPNEKSNVAYQLFQLTFVPAGIYKTKNITDDVLTNMYDAIYTMFQQSVITINIVNKAGRIKVLSKPVVYNGIHYEDKAEDLSLTRGYNDKFMSDRRKNNTWILGYANVLTLLNDKQLQKNCLEVTIVYKDIYSSFENFYNCINSCYFNKDNLNYFLEIYKQLNIKRQNEFREKFNSYLFNILDDYKVNINQTPQKKRLKKLFQIQKQNKHTIITIFGLKLKIKEKTRITRDNI